VKSLAERSAQLCRDAVKAHQRGQLSEAQTLYEKALALRPDDPDTLNFFGVLRHNQGQSAAGVEMIQRSLQIAPQNPHAWLNLGTLLLALDENEKARSAYERASILAPESADAWLNLGFCLRKMREATAAAAALERAVQLRPAHVLSVYQRGIARREAGDFTGAEADYRAALELEPGFTDAFDSLGVLLYSQGRFADAAQVYRAWLGKDPRSSRARHLAAAMSGEETPERASDEYIVETFDQFAATFDADLINLGYRAPEFITAALIEAMQPEVSLASVLDAGCGTGFCGTLLRPITRQLVGVDLSTAMIDKARAKNCYDELHVNELCAFMRGRSAAFDAVVAADTLIYFGALEEPLAAAAICLKGGGFLAMALEKMAFDASAQTYRIEPSGRYSHRIEYVRTALEQAGFVLVAANERVLRRERRRDVQGLVVSARLCTNFTT